MGNEHGKEINIGANDELNQQNWEIKYAKDIVPGHPGTDCDFQKSLEDIEDLYVQHIQQQSQLHPYTGGDDGEVVIVITESDVEMDMEMEMEMNWNKKAQEVSSSEEDQMIDKRETIGDV